MFSPEKNQTQKNIPNLSKKESFNPNILMGLMANTIIAAATAFNSAQVLAGETRVADLEKDVTAEVVNQQVEINESGTINFVDIGSEKSDVVDNVKEQTEKYLSIDEIESNDSVEQTTETPEYNTNPTPADYKKLDELRVRVRELQKNPVFPVNAIIPNRRQQNVTVRNTERTNIDYENGQVLNSSINNVTDKKTILVPTDAHHSGVYTESITETLNIFPHKTTDTKTYEQETSNTYLTLHAQAVKTYEDGRQELFFRPTAPLIVRDFDASSTNSYKFNPDIKIENGSTRGINFTAPNNAPAPEGFVNDLVGGTTQSRYDLGTPSSLNMGGKVGEVVSKDKTGFTHDSDVTDYAFVAGSSEQRTFSHYDSDSDTFNTRISQRGVYAITSNDDANLANVPALGIPLTLENRKIQAEQAEKIQREHPETIDSIPKFSAVREYIKDRSDIIKKLQSNTIAQTILNMPDVTTRSELDVTTYSNGNSIATQISFGADPIKTRNIETETDSQVNSNGLKPYFMIDGTTRAPSSRVLLRESGNSKYFYYQSGGDVVIPESSSGPTIDAASGAAVFTGGGIKETTFRDTYTTEYTPITASASVTANIARPNLTTETVKNAPEIFSFNAKLSAAIFPGMDEGRLAVQASAVYRPTKNINISANLVRTTNPEINMYNLATVSASYKFWDEKDRNGSVFAVYNNFTGNQGKIDFFSLPETSISAGINLNPAKGLNIRGYYFNGSSEIDGDNVSGISASISKNFGNFSGSANITSTNKTTCYGINLGLNFPKDKWGIGLSYTHKEDTGAGSNPEGENVLLGTVNAKF